MIANSAVKLGAVVLAFCLAGVIVAASAEPPDAAGGLAAWRAEREAALRSENGWLTLVALAWLRPGENRFGSAKDCAVVLDAPGIPADAGSIFLEGERVRVASRAGAALTLDGAAAGDRELRTDAEGKPDVLRLGRLSFYVIRRGDRFGVRVKDPEAPTRKNFRGLTYFPESSSHRVAARFVRFQTARELSGPPAIGGVEKDKATGRLEFAFHGQALSLIPFADEKTGALFIVFRDATSGTTTYGAGRFLDADPPKDGEVFLDFDRAYNPPCAFTPFATCPLPPRENRLPVAVEAGEKKYGDH